MSRIHVRVIVGAALACCLLAVGPPELRAQSAGAPLSEQAAKVDLADDSARVTRATRLLEKREEREISFSEYVAGVRHIKKSHPAFYGAFFGDPMYATYDSRYFYLAWQRRVANQTIDPVAAGSWTWFLCDPLGYDPAFGGQCRSYMFSVQDYLLTPLRFPKWTVAASEQPPSRSDFSASASDRNRPRTDRFALRKVPPAHVHMEVASIDRFDLDLPQTSRFNAREWVRAAGTEGQVRVPSSRHDRVASYIRQRLGSPHAQQRANDRSVNRSHRARTTDAEEGFDRSARRNSPRRAQNQAEDRRRERASRRAQDDRRTRERTRQRSRDRQAHPDRSRDRTERRDERSREDRSHRDRRSSDRSDREPRSERDRERE